MTADHKLAVLIDAENVTPSIADDLLVEVAKYGTSFVKRAYGNWTEDHLTGWKGILLTHSIQPIQQFAYTKGKNATDSAMIIDAMDLLYTGRFDGFCLVSSDSDFTRLAARIRESGLFVYGFGEQKTPKPFISACDKFLYFENITIRQQLGLPTVGSSVSPTSPTQIPPSKNMSEEELEQLRKAVAGTSDEEGWANLAKVGNRLNQQSPDFDSRSFGFAKLGDLIRYTGLFDIDSRNPGAGKPAVAYAREKPQLK